MKTYLKLLLLVLITTFTVGNLKAQEKDQDIQHAKSEIVGEWVRKDCSDCKIVFTNNMEEKYYIDGELIWSYQYDIDRVCEDGQSTLADNLLLITYDNSGNKLDCDIIQALNNNNSGILSITTENQGKNIVYERQ